MRVRTIQHPLFSKNSAPTISHDKWIKMSQKMTGIANTVITHLALLCSGKKNWRGLWRRWILKPPTNQSGSICTNT